MLELDEARIKITAALTAISDYESVALAKAFGRILAEDVVSNIDVPPADNSAMDGYAFRFQDLITNGEPLFPISQRIQAGAVANSLEPGTAARIFTGAELPDNADTVVMQENCSLLDENSVRVNQAARRGENVRPRGQDIQEGSTVLMAGQHLDAQHIGLLASIGCATVKVKRRLNVAVISTGNELAPPGQPLKQGQIYNSNQFMLLALLEKIGCTSIDCGFIEDSLSATQNALAKAAKEADLIISSGGVSVGEEDYVKQAVQNLGELDVWKINIKPGKPLAFGKIGQCAFLGLPGNPVSAYVTFLLLGLPVIKALSGAANPAEAVRPFYCKANFSSGKAAKRPEYLRVKLTEQGVEPHPNQSSGVMSSVCWADALALLPANTLIERGDLLALYPLEHFFAR